MQKKSKFPIEKKNVADWDALPIVLLLIGLILAVAGLRGLKGYLEEKVYTPGLTAYPIESSGREEEELETGTVAIEEQAAPEISDRDIIAMVVMSEAGGEKFIGKVAVAAVVLNRASESGMTIEEVVTQENQFVYPYYGTVSAACYEAVDFAMRDRDLFPRNMLYFRSFKYHEDLGTPYIQIGGHYFSTEGEPEFDIETLGPKD